MLKKFKALFSFFVRRSYWFVVGILSPIMEATDGIRKRIVGTKDRVNGERKEEKERMSGKSSFTHGNLTSGTYWLTRIVFLRALGLIYCKYVLRNTSKVTFSFNNVFPLGSF